MKKIKFVLILILFAHVVIAQKNAVNQYYACDKKALAIPDSLTKNTTDIANYISTNFYSKSDKIRAIFIWIASNISYDLENIFTIDFNETIEEKISKPLITRKGICGNYAALFTDICLKVGIESYVISGYTKQYGYVSNLSHAWNAAFIDSTWFLFDPTWGAGYVNNDKFFRKINNNWFKVKPNQFIKDHIPFDYLWQFLDYPINN
jgi:transglutaminase/protease-like cytokinesis protein 3